ncbi:MAG: hypothetical protein RSE22_00930, partial [Mucinivorans sp.]
IGCFPAAMTEIRFFQKLTGVMGTTTATSNLFGVDANNSTPSSVKFFYNPLQKPDFNDSYALTLKGDGEKSVPAVTLFRLIQDNTTKL